MTTTTLPPDRAQQPAASLTHPASRAPARTARPRHYVMCPPTYFAVVAPRTPWMDPTVPVDVDLALQQWAGLVAVHESLGHRVELLAPDPALPDMVFTANGSAVVAGVALGATFRHPERRGEAVHHRDLLARHGIPVHESPAVSEGEGDVVVVGDLVLAGTGFRTERAAHAAAQEVWGRPVVSLQLVDPRFYHLDTCLVALDDRTVAWFPAAFSPGSQAVVRTLFPDAVEAGEADALVLGLNAVSDGRHVVLPAAATRLAETLGEHGFEPVGVELSELLKGGGGPKCATGELRPAVPR